MGTVSKPNTFAAAQTIVATEHNSNFDTIYNDYNGNITNANLSGSAGITDANLAQISSASKVSGAALTSLTSVPSGAGLMPPANGGVPSGAILAWSGAISAIPTGWVICDGANSTPDLTGAFIMHADADSGGTHNPDDTPTMTSAHDHTTPNHLHTLRHNVSSGRPVLETVPAGSDENTTGYQTSSGSGTSGSTGSQTGYALAYIMKT